MPPLMQTARPRCAGGPILPFAPVPPALARQEILVGEEQVPREDYGEGTVTVPVVESEPR